jgi:hypothetical protein
MQMSEASALTVRMVVLWLAVGAMFVVRATDNTVPNCNNVYLSVVPVTISPAGVKGIAQPNDACVNGHGGRVTFSASGTGKFTAVFEPAHPFIHKRRIYATGLFTSGDIDPAAMGHMFRYEVCYYTDDHSDAQCSDPKVIVSPVNGPFILVSTNLIDFGSQSIDTPSRQKLLISRVGSEAPLPVNFEPRREPPFEITRCIAPKDEKDKCTITITFTPTVVGPTTKPLIIQYQDEGKTKEITVEVIGRGKPRKP